MIPQLQSLPRTRLAHLPTPLEPLERLTDALGGPRIWIKRDDCTGLGTGGNKTRKLEFLLGAAEAEGAEVVITFGAVQSNHARQTAAACAARGLTCHLILARKVPWTDPNYETLGNVLLDHLFGARVHLLEADEVRSEFQRLRDELDAEGRKSYVIPTGGSNGTGALGYAVCADELAEQSEALDLPMTDIVHATSSAGTQAGLLAGLALLDRPQGVDRSATTRVHGINVSEPPADEPQLIATIAALANDALQLTNRPPEIEAAAVLVDSGYVGEGYGLPTAETYSAVHQLAELEGILLDPVYSGKAMSGLIGKIHRGEFNGTSDIIFLHTGGSAALPVYGAALIDA